MISLNTYLSFDGNCEEAFNFYKSVFGGEFSFMSYFKDMPGDEPNNPKDEKLNDKIMHISFPIGDTVLMGSDTGGEWSEKLSVGNNFSLSINTESKEEADRLFYALSVNGKITMPMNLTFWNSYFGMFTDQFGIQWMISFEANKKEK